MNRLDKLYQITEELEALLNQDVSSKNRETTIEEVNVLVERRGNLLKEVTPPFSEDEKRTGEKLVDMNNTIQQKMNLLFHDLKREMKQIKQQKKSNRTYTNPYEKVQTMDGMFMDRKK